MNPWFNVMGHPSHLKKIDNFSKECIMFSITMNRTHLFLRLYYFLIIFIDFSSPEERGWMNIDN